MKLIKNIKLTYDVNYEDFLQFLKDGNGIYNNLTDATDEYLKSLTGVTYNTKNKDSELKLYENENIDDLNFYLTINKYNL